MAGVEYQKPVLSEQKLVSVLSRPPALVPDQITPICLTIIKHVKATSTEIPAFKLIGPVYSDGVDGSTPTASHCAMLLQCDSQQRKEPTTWRLQHSGSIWPSPSFSFMALIRMALLFCRGRCEELLCSMSSAGLSLA
ncbi:hypothetical protein [Silicimonas algicola]|uniref:hypothetical protein n=1 Tax=Silicimonas algicola TaxID=1826607 RepID=UPI001F494475|nr:hypothetical protein [Silicimonas algicola]